jgi:hypothetical protein
MVRWFLLCRENTEYEGEVSGLEEDFDGTVKQLFDRLSGGKAKLHVVVKRDQDAQDEPGADDMAPDHIDISTPSPAPIEANKLVVAEPVVAQSGI